MKRTIFFKLFGGYLIITIALAALILIFSFQTIKSHYINSLTNNLKNVDNTFSWEITPLLLQKKFQKVDSLVKIIGNKLNMRITVIIPDGAVIADSKVDPKTMENHRNRPEIIQAFNRQTGKSIRFSSTLKEEMLYVAEPIINDRQTLGVFRTSLELKAINILLKDIRSKIFQIALIITILSLIGGLILARSLSKPIGLLADAARRVAAGDFSVRIFLKKQDELKELADSFNQMTAQIKNSFTELSQQKDELNIIIASVQEGFVVLDSKGKIRMSNVGFNNIVQNNSVEGKFYWEVLRAPNFGELVKKVKDEKTNRTEELELDGRVFLTSLAYLAAKDEVVIILHDITEFRKLEKIKRDFVVSASHELRTPLTAIKGYVETLEGKTSKKNQQYLDVIKRHTERMINIIQDLLNLSELEEKESRTDFEKVNIEKLIENIKTLFEPRFKERNLALKIDVEENLPMISGDSFRLEQMMINLIDNAIKYTEKGEVHIAAWRLNHDIRIEVKDTGIGMAKEHLPRIFERFYVVDKSHSRKMGGTGLGLSIVKHIVLLHNGKIDVESTPGVGTRFIITLPFS